MGSYIQNYPTNLNWSSESIGPFVTFKTINLLRIIFYTTLILMWKKETGSKSGNKKRKKIEKGYRVLCSVKFVKSHA